MTELAIISPVLGPRQKAIKEWYSRKEAAIYLAAVGCPISVRALEKRAANNNEGRGPAFTRIGWKTVKYARADLEAFAAREAVRIP